MELSTAEEMALAAQAVKTLTEAAGNALGIEAAAESEPFFTEEETRSIAEAMATYEACPNGLTCEGEHGIPCNVCWVDYLMGARR